MSESPPSPQEPVTPETTPPPAPRRRSAFWPFLYLTLALLAAKAWHIGQPEDYTPESREAWLKEFWLLTHEDLAFALGAGMTAQLLLVLASGSAKLRRFAWPALLTACVLALLYAIISALVLDSTRSHPTVSLIRAAGGLTTPAWGLLTGKVLGLLLAATAAFVLLATVSARYLRPVPWLWPRLLVLTLIAWWVHGKHQAGRSMLSTEPHSERHDIRVAYSPHVVLLASIARSLRSGPATASRPPDPTDFLPVSQRASIPEPTLNLKRGPRNVIIISLESVATRYLSLYGSRYATTPRLEAESRHALVFDSIYSPVTNSGNAQVAMSLSQHPPMSWREYSRRRPDMPGTMLPALLKPRGYRTAFISGCDNNYANTKEMLTGRGFDIIWDYRDSGCDPISFWGVEDRCMVDMILKFIDRGRLPGDASSNLKSEISNPFYVFAWSQGTHHPYEPGPDWRAVDFLRGDELYSENMTYEIRRYLPALYEMDRQLGRLFDELRRRNLADDTIVVLMGDHGFGFGWPHPTIGHSGKVYDGCLRVPFIIWSPSLFKDEPRRKTVGGLVDLTPTVADLLNIPPAASWQGHSLLSPAHPNRAYFYGSKDTYLLAVREGRFKYILDTTSDRATLFDLDTDPDEQTDVSAKHPDVCARLHRRVCDWTRHQIRAHKAAR